MSNFTLPDQDLTTYHAEQVADAITVAGIRSVTERPNVLARHVRDWMSTNAGGTLTDRTELQEAVLHVLRTRHNEEFGPAPRPSPVFGAFR